MSFGFDTEEFDLELEESNRSTGSGPRKRQEPLPVAGPEIKFARAGIFEVKTINKQGKEVKKFVNELQVILLDAKFGRQKWGEENGKPRMLCSTTSHSVRTREGGIKEIEGGWWQIPYGAAPTDDKYDPVGSRVTADGTLLKCVDCKAQGLNEDCSQRGALYVTIVGMSDDDGEIKAVSKPFIATIATPAASGVAFQIYTRNKLNEAGYRPSQVVSRLTIKKTPNGLANQLSFELDDRAEDGVVAEAQQQLKEAIEKFKEEENRKAEEWRAKRQANAPAAPTKRSTPKKEESDDDFDF